MKQLTVIFSLWLGFGVTAWAQSEPPKEETPTRWQMLSDVEQRKKELFAEYQEEKERLETEYIEAVQKLEKDRPEDYMRQKIRLEKKYKYQKGRLLDDFRRYNLALEKREAALKGRRYVPHRELGTLYRLRRGEDKEPVIGTQPQSPPLRRNFLTATEDQGKSYTRRTKRRIGNLNKRRSSR